MAAGLIVEQVLVGDGATVTVTFTNDDESSPVDATGQVLVDVTSLDGTAVATDAVAADASGTGAYSWTMPARSAPDVLTVVFSGTFAGRARRVTSQIEIVGAHYFAISALRTLDNQQATSPPLADPAKWPNVLLRQARLEAEREAMRIMGHSCTPRAARERLVARRGVLTPSRCHVREVRAATSVSDAAELDVSSWTVEGETGSWVRCGLADGTAVELVYEHGEDFAEVEIARACLVRARHALARFASRMPEATERYNVTEHGTIFLAQPSARSTGNAHVDAVYGAHSTQVGFA